MSKVIVLGSNTNILLDHRDPEHSIDTILLLVSVF